MNLFKAKAELAHQLQQEVWKEEGQLISSSGQGRGRREGRLGGPERQVRS
jgi:hypothetical protein